MNKPIIFFNHSGIGDVILTKPFCKKIIELLKVQSAFYAHRHSDKITSDLCNFVSLNTVPDPHAKLINTKNALYFNTYFFDNTDITPISRDDTSRCYYEFLLDGFNYQLKQLDISIVNSVDELMWNPTYTHSQQIKKIFTDINNESKNKVLIYNQATFAGQSDNVGMQALIGVIAKRHPNTVFYVSQDYNSDLSNTVNVSKEFLKSGNSTANNLLEISTLSKYCNVIVGPANGPLFSSWVRSNICNERKTYITTITPELSRGRTQYYSNQRSKNIITYSTMEMFNQLDSVLAIKSV